MASLPYPLNWLNFMAEWVWQSGYGRVGMAEFVWQSGYGRVEGVSKHQIKRNKSSLYAPCWRTASFYFLYRNYIWNVRNKLYGHIKAKNDCINIKSAPYALFAIIFFKLKARAKKAKSILTLSLPKWRKRRYAILYFI